MRRADVLVVLWPKVLAKQLRERCAIRKSAALVSQAHVDRRPVLVRMMMQRSRERDGPAAGAIEMFFRPAEDEFFGESRLAAIPHAAHIAKPTRQGRALRHFEQALADAIINRRPGNLR